MSLNDEDIVENTQANFWGSLIYKKHLPLFIAIMTVQDKF